jgi:hypothetical protein
MSASQIVLRETRATIRRDMLQFTAWEYMLRRGPATAMRNDIELKDLIFGTSLA